MKNNVIIQIILNKHKLILIMEFYVIFDGLFKKTLQVKPIRINLVMKK